MMRPTPTAINTMAIKAFGLSSFTTVGHILHVNLKENLLPEKHLIGQALLDKNKRALLVVNKVNTINNEYRNFEIEIIAKRPDCTLTEDELMIVEVNENKCRFKFDFSQVYWNSRLSTEHERMIAKFNPNHDLVYDLFAGVGPFAVPAAKHKCKVYANDLNPNSAKWLDINFKRNKVKPEFYEVHNMDAKDFILEHMKEKLVQDYQSIKAEDCMIKPKIHTVMNLPALAPTFLKHFDGLFKDNAKDFLPLFRELSLEHIVYCYCFLKGAFDDPKQEVRKIIEDGFGRELKTHQVRDIFKVRNVAPYKDMYRVEILLDEEILFGQHVGYSFFNWKFFSRFWTY